MSKPKLPSELHPDYPQGTSRVDPVYRLTVYKPAIPEDFIRFYKAHPEFAGEGYYEMQCPFCGNLVEEYGLGSACCGEAGRGEWVLVEEFYISTREARQHLRDIYWDGAPSPEILFWEDFLNGKED